MRAPSKNIVYYRLKAFLLDGKKIYAETFLMGAWRKTFYFLFCLGAGFISGPHGFSAGVVTSTNQSALNAALVGGGTVTFAISGTIFLNTPITISNNTVLDGTGQQVSISGQNLSQSMFVITSNISVSITNLLLQNGLSLNGGSISNAGILQLTSCVITDNFVGSSNANQGAAGGGGVYNSGTLRIFNSLFVNNQAMSFPTSAGGAIFNSGSLQISNSIFISNNVAVEPQYYGDPGYGGAIYNVGILAVWNTTFYGNSAVGVPANFYNTYYGGSGLGGAVFNNSNAIIINCGFSNNFTAGGYGEAYTQINYAVSGTGGAAYGGAVCSSNSLTLVGCYFTKNIALGGTGGTGATGASSSGTTSPGQLGGTGGFASGGAVCAMAGSIMAINDTFLNNSAIAGQGGTGGDGGLPSLHYQVGGMGGNGGQGGEAYGGALGISLGSFSVTNVTIASNLVVNGLGGGAGPGGSGPYYTITGSPGIAGVTGTGGGGECMGNGGGVITLKNSLLAANAISDTNIFGPVTDAGNNISFDSQSSLTNSTSLNGINPLLAPPAFNGGPTPTMALMAGLPLRWP